jgi:Flp pilus assembly secretin CpaC
MVHRDYLAKGSSSKPGFRCWPAALFLCVVLVSLVGVSVHAQQSPSLPVATQTQPTPTPAVKPDPKKARAAYEVGVRAEKDQDWDTAYTSYTDAANWAPTERQYQLRREIARSRVVQAKMDAAERDAIAGHLDDARRELQAATYIDPSDAVARERLSEIDLLGPGKAPEVSKLNIGGEPEVEYLPGKRNFNYRGDTQGAYDEVARQFGVEAAFDVDIRPRAVTFRIDDVDFDTAMRLLGNMTGTFWRPLTHRMFFVSDDTPQKRKDYDASVVRTVVLPSSETPEEMTEMLRMVREIAGITRSDLDTSSRTLTLRASPHAIAVAGDLIDNLEQPVGELVLEIDVLEVDRDYSRQLGITPPQTTQVVTPSPQQIQQAQLGGQNLIAVIDQLFGTPSALSGLSAAQIASLVASGNVTSSTLIPPVVAFGGGQSTFFATVPGATANFAEMLSLVKHGQRILLRAQDGQPATFFVGSRIPVSLATFSSSLSGTGSNTTGLVPTNLPITNYAVGNSPAFVATASLRDNSINDLIVANSADNTIGVLLGDGTGNFATQVTYPAGTDPVWIATGQFNNNTSALNNDMFLDLAVVNKAANTVSVFLGNGDGTFQPRTDLATGATPVSVVAADFHDLTGTGFIDLAVANQADNTISIFQGNGDGTFKPPTLLSLAAGSMPSALAVGDFNNDGHQDLAVANEALNTVSVFLGKGDGTFQPRTDYAVGDSPVWVSVADINEDGRLDIITANNGAATSTNVGNSVSVLLGQAAANGTANGTFAPPAGERDFPAGNGPASITIADFNIDGLPDLAVADQGDNAVSFLLNLGGGLFGPNFELPVGTSPDSVVSADFNGDSSPDVAVANNGSANVSVILNSSSFGPSSGVSAGTPFPGVEYLDIGLKVKATPRIHANDEVTLALNFDLSSLTGQSFNAIPVISNESTDQTIRVKENETAALAGFIQSQVTNAMVGNPGISDVPGIGLLDQNNNAQQQSSELLILVTPRIVRFAPRTDHAIYAGQGSLDTAGSAETPANPAPPAVAPAGPQSGQAQPPASPRGQAQPPAPAVAPVPPPPDQGTPP